MANTLYLSAKIFWGGGGDHFGKYIESIVSSESYIFSISAFENNFVTIGVRMPVFCKNYIVSVN